MKLPTPHSRFAEFFATLKNSHDLFTPWAGKAFRCSEPRYACLPYVLTGTGSIIAGGRWNMRGLFPAIYLSTDAQTVAAEADQNAYKTNWAIETLKPQTRVVFELRLQRVLNLVSAEVLNRLDTSRDELVAVQWKSEQNEGREALTQALARAAFENCADALLVPSAQRTNGTNIILFVTNCAAQNACEVLHPEDLPLVHGL